MKGIVISFMTLFILSSSLQAQIEETNGALRDRLEAMKVAFITEKVGLSADQAKVFWPLYDQYEADKKAIRQQYRAGRKLIQMSDTDLEQYILNNFKRDEELLTLDRSYFSKFKTVITVRQIALLKSAERDFNREVLKKMMNWQQRQKRPMIRNN